MEFRSPAEESIRLATPLIRILGTFFSGGWREQSTSNRLISLDQLRVAICIQRTDSAGRAIVWSKPRIIPAAIAGGNNPSNQLPTFGRSPFNAASEPSPKPHYPTLARLHPGC
jgi:hypothetical protein